MKHRLFILLLATAIVSGCSTPYILSYNDYDQAVDFSKYKTFSWIPHIDNDNTPYHNQIIFNNSINYFSHELVARGMILDNENPDVLFELKVTESKKKQNRTGPYNCSCL
ncbi:MAG: DUF4136 domain-containing protein [Lacibacter sp.]|jgi:hypothetical protein